jgi:type VI secretion system protein ImpE
MNATELYQSGKLAEAITAQTAEVKTDPVNQGKRLFLFELHAFNGDLDRARRQLDAVTSSDVAIVAAFQQYKLLLDAEQQRRDFFAKGKSPGFFAPGPEHMRLRLEAVEKLRLGHVAEAVELIRQADAATPPLKGTLNGKPFEHLRDADDLFGPILEVLARGNYYWVPLDQVAALAANVPRYPRDLLWLPARMTLADGQEGEIFIPALYHDSQAAADETLKLGRGTDWKQTPGGPVVGVGARTYLVGEEAIDLREWREVVFEGPAEGEPPASA